MSRFFFLIFSLLLSFSTLASSTVFAINDDSVIRSDRANLNNKNVIKVVGKNQPLQRLTMHYSGWSFVSLDGLNGWILSEKLTSTPPISDENNTKKIPNALAIQEKLLAQLKDKIQTLTQKNSLLESENNRLNTHIVKLKADLKASNSVFEQMESSTNTDETSPKLENSDDLVPLSQDNYFFSFMGNFNTNWIYLSVAILVVLLIAIFSIYSKNKRRHFDLNTIKRH
jgi:regulator of replication initiation timing